MHITCENKTLKHSQQRVLAKLFKKLENVIELEMDMK